MFATPLAQAGLSKGGSANMLNANPLGAMKQAFESESFSSQPGEPFVHFDLLPSRSLVVPSGSLVVPSGP